MKKTIRVKSQNGTIHAADEYLNQSDDSVITLPREFTGHVKLFACQPSGNFRHPCCGPHGQVHNCREHSARTCDGYGRRGRQGVARVMTKRRQRWACRGKACRNAATVCCEMCRVPMCVVCLRLSWTRTCIACHNWLYALIRVGGIDVYRRT